MATVETTSRPKTLNPLQMFHGSVRALKRQVFVQMVVSIPHYVYACTLNWLTRSTATESTASSATTDVKLEPLGEGNRDVISMMDNLQKLGLSDLNIQLAKCVIVGEMFPVFGNSYFYN
jgi:hypothetical protein